MRKNPAEVIAAAFDEAEYQLDLIRAQAARRGVSIHIDIDIIHVLEYIWGAA